MIYFNDFCLFVKSVQRAGMCYSLGFLTSDFFFFLFSSSFFWGGGGGGVGCNRVVRHVIVIT